MSRKQSSKFNGLELVEIFEMSRNGLTDKEIAQRLRIHPTDFSTLKRNDPTLRKTIEKAHLARSEKHTLKHFIYGRLTPRLQRIWDRINELDDMPNGMLLAERILANEGDEVRKHLYFHALICCNFNSTEAAGRVGVNAREVRKWILTDPDFAELVAGVQTWKKDFAESCLFARLAEGDTSVAIFVNRTLNRDRGYNEKVDIQLSGTVKSEIDYDRLSVETKRRILAELGEPETLEGEPPRLLAPDDEGEAA